MGGMSDRIETTEFPFDDDVLTPERQFYIHGSNTRFEFLRHVETADGSEWVEARGPNGAFRAFTLDRIRSVIAVRRGRRRSS